ncbi:hypothetical protein COO60DRAFT_1642782 [Scenedesmus sp. NREL 46B-D3]|nr:hypothetical protein COO60DRAFT_1642782 [Scenedesmus sp. NREL 46B-D3]
MDMAEQNAKLVAAYVEKKREVKQLQAAAKEDGASGSSEETDQQQQAQIEQLQQRAQQLEAENATLRQEQALAQAQQERMARSQQAEQLKQRGNAAFQAQQYRQAHDAYSEALALNIQEPTLNAVLLCNRAAALHACGQYLDAIADCCLAAQLEDKYSRVLQRRADAFLAVEDFSSAVADLQQLVQLCGGSSSTCREAAARLRDAQQRQRLQGSAGPDHYAVLGLQQGCSMAEVKAAYRKLALKHHPDKASGASAKAAAELVFVLITAANAVLSDPAKRAQHDAARLNIKAQPATSSTSTSSSASGGMYSSWHYPQRGGFGYAAAAEAAAAKAATAAAAEAARWRSSNGAGGGTSSQQQARYPGTSGSSSSGNSSGGTYQCGSTSSRFA